MYTIGKPKNLRCFKNRSISCESFSQSRAWMTSDIWEQILTKFNDEIELQNRKIILFKYNAVPHKSGLYTPSRIITFKTLYENKFGLLRRENR